MAESGSVVRCTEADTVRVEVETEGRGVAVSAKAIQAVHVLLAKCQQRYGKLEVKPTALMEKVTWTAGFQEEMPGEKSEYSCAGGATPLAAVLALAEMLG